MQYADGAGSSRIPLVDAVRDHTTILVVEDEILVRAMLADALREQGHRVIEAADAEEAVAILRSDVEIDLVLTDVQMPGALDGIGLAHLIRTEFPAMKVVVVSGRLPAWPTEATADTFFTKPYDLRLVAKSIDRLIGKEMLPAGKRGVEQ